MKKIIATASAPSAIGPYSQATSINGMVYTSGQLGIDPATGNFATQDIAGQTLQSLKNVKSVLEAAGSGMDKVVKVTEGSFPSRSAVEVARLPKDGLVEIEAIATV
ncbi:MAG: Rid family hydrolase [Angelakisella sp.]